MREGVSHALEPIPLLGWGTDRQVPVNRIETHSNTCRKPTLAQCWEHLCGNPIELVLAKNTAVHMCLASDNRKVAVPRIVWLKIEEQHHAIARSRCGLDAPSIHERSGISHGLLEGRIMEPQIDDDWCTDLVDGRGAPLKIGYLSWCQDSCPIIDVSSRLGRAEVVRSARYRREGDHYSKEEDQAKKPATHCSPQATPHTPNEVSTAIFLESTRSTFFTTTVLLTANHG